MVSRTCFQSSPPIQPRQPCLKLIEDHLGQPFLATCLVLCRLIQVGHFDINDVYLWTSRRQFADIARPSFRNYSLYELGGSDNRGGGARHQRERCGLQPESDIANTVVVCGIASTARFDDCGVVQSCRLEIVCR